MIKKLLLALVLITQISVLPSWGAETILIDRITQSEAEELDIQIPPETPSGFHQIQIEVYDDAGTISAKTILFCKNLLGEIKWDNNCPDLVEAAEGFMKPYDPLDNPEDTQSTQIAAFALLAALAAGKAAGGKNSDNSRDGSAEQEGEQSRDDYEESEESEDLASVGAGGLALIKRKGGWGDRSKTWRIKRTDSVDLGWKRFAESISSFSPLAARTFGDGSYLRAMVGSLSTLLYPVALGLGIYALLDSDRQALPPATWVVIAIALLGTIDAAAGLLASATFVIGVAVSGNIFSREEVLTVAGLSIIFFREEEELKVTVKLGTDEHHIDEKFNSLKDSDPLYASKPHSFVIDVHAEDPAHVLIWKKQDSYTIDNVLFNSEEKESGQIKKYPMGSKVTGKFWGFDLTKSKISNPRKLEGLSI